MTTHDEQDLRKARDELEIKVTERTSELRRSERELRDVIVELQRREAYLAEAQRLSHTGSFGWSVSSGEISWSDETFRIFECDPKVKPTLEFSLSRIHPDDREPVQQQIERATRDGEGFAIEHRLQLPGGSIKHVRVTAHSLRDRAGNLEFVGAVTDITDQRRAEESVRQSEAYLAEAQKLSHTGAGHGVQSRISGTGRRNATAFWVSIHRMVCLERKSTISGFIPATNPASWN